LRIFNELIYLGNFDRAVPWSRRGPEIVYASFLRYSDRVFIVRRNVTSRSRS
jgi:hypothetical protein